LNKNGCQNSPPSFFWFFFIYLFSFFFISTSFYVAESFETFLMVVGPAAALPPPQFATKRLQIIPKEGRKQTRELNGLNQFLKELNLRDVILFV
jgi:hypothetical protein